MNYQSFEQVTVRTPILPFNVLKDILNRDITLSSEDLFSLFNTPIVKEAIYLASPILYKRIIKWESGEIKDKDEVERIKKSVIKYITRMATRATPYGLFSSLTVGTVSQKGNNFPLVKDLVRHNRLNLSLLNKISEKINSDKKLQEFLIFFPNSTLYRTGDKMRYYERVLLEKEVEFQISEVDFSAYLQSVIEIAEDGTTKKQIRDFLISEEIPENVATDYVNELINNQILISELTPNINVDFFSQIQNFLNKVAPPNSLKSVLEEIGNQLEELVVPNSDKELNENLDRYKKIRELLHSQGIKASIKNLIHTDTYSGKIDLTFSDNEIKDLKKVLRLIYYTNKIQPDKELEELAKSFKKIYGNREIELFKIFDPQFNIVLDSSTGYLEHPLIDDLPFERKVTSGKSVSITNFEGMILRKIIAFHGKTIKLTDGDFEINETSEDFEDLHDTFSVFTQLVIEGNTKKILFNNSGGSSAANVIARFGENKEVSSLLEKISSKENEINSGKLCAEIEHFPKESRLGYLVTKTNSCRFYHVPFLTNPTPNNTSIQLRDIMVSCEPNNKLILKSKKYNKEIIPYITNAHNTYHKSSLPLYRLFGSLKYRNKRTGIGLNLDNLLDLTRFVPRIEYKNIIVSKAKWKISSEEIPILDSKENPTNLLNLKNFQQKYNLPDFLILNQFDHKLLISLKNLDSFGLLKSFQKKFDFLEFEEFFPDTPISSHSQKWMNEIIFHFYKT